MLCLFKDKPHHLGGRGGLLFHFPELSFTYLTFKKICKSCVEAEEMSLLKNHNFSNPVRIEKTKLRPQYTRWQIKHSSYFFTVFKNHLTSQHCLCD